MFLIAKKLSLIMLIHHLIKIKDDFYMNESKDYHLMKEKSS